MNIDTQPADTGPYSDSATDRVQLRKHVHMRRQRAAKACMHCHSRKVRCDLAAHGSPCTNCRRDSVSCKTLEGRRGVWKKHAELAHLDKVSKHSKKKPCSNFQKDDSSASPEFGSSSETRGYESGVSSMSTSLDETTATLQQLQDDESKQLRAASLNLLEAAKQLLQRTQALTDSRREKSMNSWDFVATRSKNDPISVERDPTDSAEETVWTETLEDQFSNSSSTPPESMTWYDDLGLFPIEPLGRNGGQWNDSDVENSRLTISGDTNIFLRQEPNPAQEDIVFNEEIWSQLQHDEWPCFPG